jgi:hypothetical protein
MITSPLHYEETFGIKVSAFLVNKASRPKKDPPTFSGMLNIEIAFLRVKG